MNKIAWFADLSEQSNHIIYGPYEVLPGPGNYVAFFKIKTDDNSSTRPRLLLDVTGGGSAARIIRGIHFRQPNKYQLFGVPFECRVIKPMEYRAFSQRQWEKIGRRIWIDYVAIVRSSVLAVPLRDISQTE